MILDRLALFLLAVAGAQTPKVVTLPRGVCAVPDAAAMIAVAVASAGNGGTVVIPCQVKLASTVTIKGNRVTVKGSGTGGFRAAGVGTAWNGVLGGILFDVRSCEGFRPETTFVRDNEKHKFIFVGTRWKSSACDSGFGRCCAPLGRRQI